ncbi:MAG: hypothetical protein ACFB16_07500 [Phormidesmis sp.]
MTISTVAGATASTDPSAVLDAVPLAAAPSEPNLEAVRHMLFGTPTALQITIKRLHKLGYAEPNDWSRPISTGRPGEVMAILTKRVDVSA